MINVNWNDVEEVSFPVAGAYKAKIINVKDVPEREFIVVNFDIADGKFKGYAQKTYDERGFYPYSMVWSYKKKALWFFKQRKMAVEATNPGFTFQSDPFSLVGKFCGIVLADEEYRNSKGEIKKRLYVADVISGNQYRDGDYEIPALKKLATNDAGAPASDFAYLDDDDAQLPF